MIKLFIPFTLGVILCTQAYAQSSNDTKDVKDKAKKEKIVSAKNKAIKKTNDSLVNILLETDIGFASSANDSRKESNAGTGTIGLKFEHGLFFGSANFTVYSTNEEILTSDTLETKLFGSNLLLPKNSSGSISNFSGVIGFKRFLDPRKDYQGPIQWILRRAGGYAYTNLNNTNWTKDTITTPVSVVSFGGNFTFDILNLELNGKNKDNIRLYTYIGYTARRLGGDYGINENDELREYYLNTDKRGFNSLEWGVKLEIGKFYGQVNMTSFNAGKNLPGFSGFQSIISMGVKADLNLNAKNLLAKPKN